MTVTCPYCDEELTQEDDFGLLLPHQNGKVRGTIYKCENEACDQCGEYFHTFRTAPDEVFEGYPC